MRMGRTKGRRARRKTRTRRRMRKKTKRRPTRRKETKTAGRGGLPRCLWGRSGRAGFGPAGTSGRGAAPEVEADIRGHRPAPMSQASVLAAFPFPLPSPFPSSLSFSLSFSFSFFLSYSSVLLCFHSLIRQIPSAPMKRDVYFPSGVTRHQKGRGRCPRNPLLPQRGRARGDERAFLGRIAEESLRLRVGARLGRK